VSRTKQAKPSKTAFGAKKAGASTAGCPKLKSAISKTAKGSTSNYARLRRASPSPAIRKLVNPPGRKKDPIYGTVEPKLEADHIVPLKKIVTMPGFSKLSYDDQKKVANLPANFLGLGKRSNASKGAKSWSEWKGHSKLGPVPSKVRQSMLLRQKAAEKALRAEIKKRGGS